MSKDKKKIKRKEKLLKSPLQNIAEKKLQSSKEKFDVNFSWLDYNQQPDGGTFESWHDNNILLDAFNTLKEFTKLTQNEIKSDWGGKKAKWVEYNRWPPNCKFNPPQHLQDFDIETLNWARIRFGSKKRIVGVLYENTFYIVFLDHDHNFWVTEQK